MPELLKLLGAWGACLMTWPRLLAFLPMAGGPRGSKLFEGLPLLHPDFLRGLEGMLVYVLLDALPDQIAQHCRRNRVHFD